MILSVAWSTAFQKRSSRGSPRPCLRRWWHGSKDPAVAPHELLALKFETGSSTTSKQQRIRRRDHRRFSSRRGQPLVVSVICAIDQLASLPRNSPQVRQAHLSPETDRL